MREEPKSTKPNPNTRALIKPGGPIRASGEVLQSLNKRLIEKGRGSFSSRHEVLGICTEEYEELIDAIQKGDLSNVKDELIDLAVACILGITCINSETLDW